MTRSPNITNWPSGHGRERVAAIIKAAKSAPLPCPRTYLREQRTRMVAEVKAARGIERSYAHAVSGHAAAASRSGVTSSRRDLFSGSFVHIGSRTALPPPRWRRGRDSWIGQLQRLKGIDQAGAEIVIALAGR